MELDHKILWKSGLHQTLRQYILGLKWTATLFYETHLLVSPVKKAQNQFVISHVKKTLQSKQKKKWKKIIYQKQVQMKRQMIKISSIDLRFHLDMKFVV